jgi:hypothetical protein
MVTVNYQISVFLYLKRTCSANTLARLKNNIKLWIEQQTGWQENGQKTYTNPRLKYAFRVKCTAHDQGGGTYQVMSITDKPSQVHVDWSGGAVRDLEEFLTDPEIEEVKDRAENWMRIEALEDWSVNEQKDWIDQSQTDAKKRVMITALFKGDVNGQLEVEVTWAGHDVTD